MKPFRLFLGLLIVAHGLAHASAGMWATDLGGRGLVTVLWELSSVGFIAAGAGVLGVDALKRWWHVLVVVASASSLLLLYVFGHPLFVVGMVMDVGLAVFAVFTWWNFSPLGRHPVMPRLLQRLMIAFIVYVAVLIGLRPWYTSWGATRSEQQMVLIGDPPLGDSHFRIDHAITINAPADSVWPWLVQIGQDRAGFYTYDWLERAFGADIHNSDSIVPAWQQRRQGDVIRAAQPDYLNGLFGRNLGWRVRLIEPGRAMVLSKWGAFVLDPVDARTTRLHIRTRGRGAPTLSGIALTPISLLIFEPAHFIMERGMLMGIKKRAESRLSAAHTL